MYRLATNTTQKTKTSIGLYAEDVANLYPFFVPHFTASFGFYLVSALK
jgi:hypothetical protein